MRALRLAGIVTLGAVALAALGVVTLWLAVVAWDRLT
jgi:hypothetical protein